jgi:hypothetical protein
MILQMRIRNLWLLTVVLAFVLVPWWVLRLTDSYIYSGILGCVWVAAAIIYYRRVRTDRALFIFLLTPIALGPIFFLLLLFMGALFGFGH